VKERGESDRPLGPRVVVCVGEALDWQRELGSVLRAVGYAVEGVPRLDAVLPMLDSGALQALLLAAGPLAASDLLLLQRVRRVSPRTAIVVVTRTPNDPDLKRAFESGATAFLSWPASQDAVRNAIDRGVPAPTTARR